MILYGCGRLSGQLEVRVSRLPGKWPEPNSTYFPEPPKSLSTLRGLESRAKIFAPSSRRGSFSVDSPLYRTGLPFKWVLTSPASYISN